MPRKALKVDSIMLSLGRILEGREEGYSGGAWQLTALRVLTGFGIPSPGTYDKSTITPEEYLRTASQNRVTIYQRIKSESEIITSLRASMPVTVSCEVTEQWNRYDEIVHLDEPNDEYIGCHCFSVVAVDEQSRTFLCRDMRPLEHGALDFNRRIPFSFFDRFMVEAYVAQYNTAPFHVKSQDQENRIRFQVYASKFRLQGDAFAFHLYDAKNHGSFAWVMATFAGNFLQVEDFFVMPDWRGGKIGRHLLWNVNEFARHLKVPLCFWIPWADHKPEDRQEFEEVNKHLGWHLAPSGVRWAAYKCHPLVKPGADITLPWIPERAGLVAPIPEQLIESLSGAWTELKNERRLELIDLKYSAGLSADQETELGVLQSQLGEYQNKIAPLPFSTFDRDD